MGIIGGIIPVRYVVVAVTMFGFMFNYGLRVNLSIAIVAMVNQSAILSHGNTSVSERRILYCAANSTPESPVVQAVVSSNISSTQHTYEDQGRFIWDEGVQGMVLSSFFWGYIVTQVPGGRFAELFGPKLVLAVSLLGTALATMFVPVAAGSHYGLVMALRILMGLLEGASYPTIQVLLSKWAPADERSRMTAIVFVGSMLGTFVILPTGGLLIAHLGWESVFYFSGAATLAWGALWLTLVQDDPANHPWVTAQELAHIRGSTGIVRSRGSSASLGPDGVLGSAAVIELGPHRHSHHHQLKPVVPVRMRQDKVIHKPVPWKAMLTSKPLMAVSLASFGHGYSFNVILALMPSYLKNIQGFDIKRSGFLSALPYLGRTIFGVSFSCLMDYLYKRGTCSRTNLRKIAVSVAYCSAGCALLLTSVSGCHSTLTMMLLIITVSAVGADYSGTAPNVQDLCPNFSGTGFGIINVAYTLAAIISPLLSGAILKGQQSLKSWGTVFQIAGVVYILVTVIYIIMGSAEEQEWNNYDEKEQERKRKSKTQAKESAL